MHSVMLRAVIKERIAAEKVEMAADYSVWNKLKSGYEPELSCFWHIKRVSLGLKGMT